MRAHKALLIWAVVTITLLVVEALTPGYGGWFWGYLTWTIGGMTFILLGRHKGWLR